MMFIKTHWNCDINAEFKNITANHGFSEAAKRFESGKIHHIFNDLHAHTHEGTVVLARAPRQMSQFALRVAPNISR